MATGMVNASTQITRVPRISHLKDNTIKYIACGAGHVVMLTNDGVPLVYGQNK